MLEHFFILKLLISFLIGGVWAIGATLAADKYGSKVGGIISGLPSTGLFSLFFLGWTQSAEFAVAATTIIPIIVGVESIFVVSYIYFLKRGFWISLILSLVLWFFLAFLLLLLKFNDFTLSLLGYLMALVFSYFMIEHKFNVTSIKGKKIVYTPKIIILRGVLSGAMVAFSVIMGKLSGPVIGGMFSGFPAMWLSTIVITYFAHGAAFSAATMKSSVIGVLSLVVHSVLVRYTYIPFGIFLGTLVSSVVSFSIGFLVYKCIIVRLK